MQTTSEWCRWSGHLVAAVCVAVWFTASARAAPADAPNARIIVGAVTGKPGERLTLPVRLDCKGFLVTSFVHDLFFDPLTAVAAAGFTRRPDCSVAVVDPGRQATYRFVPTGCGGGGACAGIHVSFVATDDTPIGDGTVYTCKVIVSQDAPPGRYPVVCQALLARNDGSLGPAARCVDGEIAVVTCLGDCSFDNQVTVNELLAGVNLGLGVPETEDCAVAWDVDRDGEVRITDLIQGVNNALDGCGTARERAGR